MNSLPFSAPKNVIDYLSLHEEILVPTPKSHQQNTSAFSITKLRSLQKMNNENVRVSGLKLPSVSKRPCVAEALHDFFKYLLGKFKIPIKSDEAIDNPLDLATSKQPVRSYVIDHVNPGVRAAEVPLPRYMEKYVNQSSELSEEVVTYLTLAESLHSYFNAALPRNLLYEREREQYEEFLVEICDENEKRTALLSSGGKTSLLDETCLNAAELYGVEYLLRMIVKMPSLINRASTITEDTQKIIADMLQELSL